MKANPANYWWGMAKRPEPMLSMTPNAQIQLLDREAGESAAMPCSASEVRNVD